MNPYKKGIADGRAGQGRPAYPGPSATTDERLYYQGWTRGRLLAEAGAPAAPLSAAGR